MPRETGGLGAQPRSGTKGVRWVFDELPPSGARRGGDPSEHAFRRDLESLVREVVQNANDQAEFLPRVMFRLRELEGERLAAYLGALEWGSLESHLDGAALAKGGAALRDFLEQLRRSIGGDPDPSEDADPSEEIRPRLAPTRIGGSRS